LKNYIVKTQNFVSDFKVIYNVPRKKDRIDILKYIQNEGKIKR